MANYPHPCPGPTCPCRRALRLERGEVPAELEGNFIVEYLTELSPTQEAELQAELADVLHAT